jgi:hypothetical protein
MAASNGPKAHNLGVRPSLPRDRLSVGITMRVSLTIVGVVALVTSLVGCATPVLAQATEHPVSIGGSVTGLGLLDDAGQPVTSPGVGAWLSVNVLGQVALDAQLDWFPTSEAIDFESQGGRTLKLMAGVRGTLIESRRLRVHGIMRGGVIRFSETMTGHDGGVQTVGPKIHGALDLGIGVELFPRSRWRPRLDFVTTYDVVPGAVLFNGGGGATATTDARIEDTFQVSAGVSYGLGTGRTVPEPAEQSVRWTAGPTGTYAVPGNNYRLGMAGRGGIGGFVSYRLWRFVHADGSVSAFPEAAKIRSPWEGGRMLQAVGGVKVGRQGKDVGLFVRGRFGVDSHDGAVKERTSSPYALTLGRSNLPVVDLGGIVEVNAGAHWLLRLEAGDTMTFYGERTVLRDGVAVPQGSIPSSQRIQVSVGAGWRF